MHAAWVIMALAGCGDDSAPAGGAGAGGAGGNPSSAGAAAGGAAAGGAAAGGAAAGGGPAGGAPAGGAPTGGAPVGGAAMGGAGGGEPMGGSSPSEIACQAYCDASAACDPNPSCVANCVNGIDDPCVAEWVPYTSCLADSYDAVACQWQFHECEPEATAVGKCLDVSICLSQCEDTAEGCSCTHACVGVDFAWDCTVDGANVSCACSQDGVPTFECSDVTGSCSTLLYAGCCLAG